MLVTDYVLVDGDAYADLKVRLQRELEAWKMVGSKAPIRKISLMNPCWMILIWPRSETIQLIGGSVWRCSNWLSLTSEVLTRELQRNGNSEQNIIWEIGHKLDSLSCRRCYFVKFIDPNRTNMKRINLSSLDDDLHTQIYRNS